jgi:DNA-directed RNA polymerase subunit M/transcription elongation factor TFIIS
MSDQPNRDDSKRGDTNDRRAFFRGGRRLSDWPQTLTEPLKCPRCGSPQAKLLDGTPETLFWECHSCRHGWSTSPQGESIGER